MAQPAEIFCKEPQLQDYIKPILVYTQTNLYKIISRAYSHASFSACTIFLHLLVRTITYARCTYSIYIDENVRLPDYSDYYKEKLFFFFQILSEIFFVHVSIAVHGLRTEAL